MGVVGWVWGGGGRGGGGGGGGGEVVCEVWVECVVGGGGGVWVGGGGGVWVGGVGGGGGGGGTYGEWLRRENRRIDARNQLRPAFESLVSIGAHAFAERARRELQATGEKVRKRNESTDADLTLQEEQIAQLARDGRTNPEIGAQLFIGSRTVEWHLRNVFAKLDISSRRQLTEALSRRRL